MFGYCAKSRTCAVECDPAVKSSVFMQRFKIWLGQCRVTLSYRVRSAENTGESSNKKKSKFENMSLSFSLFENIFDNSMLFFGGGGNHVRKISLQYQCNLNLTESK